MKELKLYMCEKCRAQYKSKDVAKQCEKNHKEIKSAEALKYTPLNNDCNHGMPVSVLITFTDGTQQRYRL